MIELIRLILIFITIIYINILSCGQNAFGAYANMNSTSDSEFIHIIMWIGLSIDGFIYLSRLFEKDDGNIHTNIIIHIVFSLLYFIAFIILLVSWINCSNEKTIFCHGKYLCFIHILPLITCFCLTILYIYSDARNIFKEFHLF